MGIGGACGGARLRWLANLRSLLPTRMGAPKLIGYDLRDAKAGTRKNVVQSLLATLFAGVGEVRWHTRLALREKR